MKLRTPRRYTQTARALSAEDTGRRIIDAFLKRILKQWFDEITLDDVADDAEVTVQTVVRRFGGKEGLLASAVKVLGSQINARRDNPSGDLSQSVRNLIDDYEETGDAVIRLLALEPRHPALREVLEFGRSEHRRWVVGSFGDRLPKLGELERQKALDALVVTTDVYTWKLLRRDMGRGTGETAAVMKQLVQATITENSKSK